MIGHLLLPAPGWNTLPEDICAIFTGVSMKTEDSFVSAILSGDYIVACVTTPVVLEVFT